MAGYTPSEIIQEALREFVGYDADEAVLAAHDTLVAREALDGLLVAMGDSGGIGPGTRYHRARMRTDVKIYRDINYPLKEDQ